MPHARLITNKCYVTEKLATNINWLINLAREQPIFSARANAFWKHGLVKPYGFVFTWTVMLQNKSIQRQGKKYLIQALRNGKAPKKMKGFCSAFGPSKARKKNTFQRYYNTKF